MVRINDIRNLIEVSVDPEIAAGIYFLCLGDDVVYVGQSTNVHARIAGHAGEIKMALPGSETIKKKFDRALVLRARPDDLNRLETAFIRLFNPPCNRSRGSRVSSIGDTMIAILAGAKVA